MEKKEPRPAAPAHDSLLTLLTRSQTGDKQAIEGLLLLFETDIQQLARTIRMPREDAVQTLKTEFIELIRKGALPMDKRVEMLRTVQYYHFLIRSYGHFEEDFPNPPYEELLAQLHLLKQRYRELYEEDPCSHGRC